MPSSASATLPYAGAPPTSPPAADRLTAEPSDRSGASSTPRTSACPVQPVAPAMQTDSDMPDILARHHPLWEARAEAPVANQVPTTVAGRMTLHHRRSVGKLTAPQLRDLRRAFKAAMAIEDDRGFWYFAGWHGIPFAWCEHHTELFLPWHRAYLYYFELALHAQVPGVSLPWWDWTTMSKIPTAYTVKKSGGRQNPLLVRKVHVYRSSRSADAPKRTPGAARVPALPYKTRW